MTKYVKVLLAKSAHFQNGTHVGEKSWISVGFGIIWLESRVEAVGVKEVLEQTEGCVCVWRWKERDRERERRERRREGGKGMEEVDK